MLLGTDPLTYMLLLLAVLGALPSPLHLSQAVLFVGGFQVYPVVWILLLSAPHSQCVAS